MQLKKPTLISMISAIAAIAMLWYFLAAPAHAEEVRAGDLVITQAWSRATPGGAKIGGGFLTIENKGSTPDRLIGGSADVAGKVEVHEMAMNNGVMTMRALDKGLTIEPGKTVKLAPGGYHLMMFDLKSPLKQGDKLPVTLEFEKAGKVKPLARCAGCGRAEPGRWGQSGRPDEEDARAFRHEDVRPTLQVKEATPVLSLPGRRIEPLARKATRAPVAIGTSATCRSASRPLAMRIDALTEDHAGTRLRDVGALTHQKASSWPYSGPQCRPQNGRKSALLSGFLLIPALVFSHPIRFHCWLPISHRFPRRTHAIVAVLSAHP